MNSIKDYIKVFLSAGWERLDSGIIRDGVYLHKLFFRIKTYDILDFEATRG